MEFGYGEAVVVDGGVGGGARRTVGCMGVSELAAAPGKCGLCDEGGVWVTGSWTGLAGSGVRGRPGCYWGSRSWWGRANQSRV